MEKKIIIWDPSNYKVLPKERKNKNGEEDQEEELKVVEEDPRLDMQNLQFDMNALADMKASAFQLSLS
jgi:hypothetical protein